MKQQEIIDNALKNIGFDELNELQQETLKHATLHDNLLILSQTGTGKTLAFLLPLLVHLSEKKKGIQAVIIAPSRELVLQLEEVFKSLKTGYKVTTSYGGHSMRVEQNSLSEAPALLIGTPGRICDHITRNTLDLSGVQEIIVDEYDKCLELGFEDQMKFIYSELTNLRRTRLVSATKLDEFPAFLSFEQPAVVDFLHQAKELELSYWKFPVTTDTKFERLFDLLCSFKGELAIVFCNFREATESVMDYLEERNYEATVYHGGMEQEDRERALLKFRNGSSHTLICTDLGSRGLDIPEIQHVVHFQYPHSKEAFIHRNGRTARMKANGSCYLLINREENIPDYVEIPSEEYSVSKKNSVPTQSEWVTLYFSGGKKNKINKVDFVGFLMQRGQLQKEEIGHIVVMDFSSYVSVKRKGVNALLQRIRSEKVKGKKLKIAISR